MGTEVLRPQDFFYDRFQLPHPAFPRRKTSSTNTNAINSGYRKPISRPDHKKKPQQPPKTELHQVQLHHLPRRSSSAPPPPVQQQQLHHLQPRRSLSVDELQNNLATNRVRILRRGQSLDTIDASRMKRDMKYTTTRRGLIKKNYMDEDDVYAGSAFFVSPSPSSLPLPSFFNNSSSPAYNMSTNPSNSTNKDNFHDSATRDLRRLLRLE